MYNKLAGEHAELKFCIKVTELGLSVSIPFGDSTKYDVIVDNGKMLHRIQVKSTKKLEKQKRSTRYHIVAGHGRYNTVYSDEQCDFVVIFVQKIDTWYIIPIQAISSKTISLYPHKEGSKAKYEQFKEAWCLLQQHPFKARGSPENTKH